MSAVRERIDAMSMFEPMSGCLLWLGSTNSASGYGRIRINGIQKQVHRVSYELAKGEIPPGLVIDHLCRCQACINPDHLEPVTERVNTHRGMGPSAINARKTHCNHGHPFEGVNLYIDPDGRRHCRECVRISSRRYAAKRKRAS